MAAVRITENFARALEEVRDFLEPDASAAFAKLTAVLFTTLIPNLEAYPELGRSLLARKPSSVEGLARAQALRQRLPANADVREYISGDYLVLYAVFGDDIALLSIKHHRQLSYDLAHLLIES